MCDPYRGSREAIDASQAEMSYVSDYKHPVQYSDEEEYSDEEYDHQDAGAASVPPEVGYAPPMTGYHPAYQGQPEYAPDMDTGAQARPGTPEMQASGHYVLATKPTSTDSFV